MIMFSPSQLLQHNQFQAFEEEKEVNFQIQRKVLSLLFDCSGQIYIMQSLISMHAIYLLSVYNGIKGESKRLGPIVDCWTKLSKCLFSRPTIMWPQTSNWEKKTILLQSIFLFTSSHLHLLESSNWTPQWLLHLFVVRCHLTYMCACYSIFI